MIIVLRKNRDIGEDILEKKKGKGSFIFVVAIFLCGCFFLLPLEMRDIKYSLFLLGVLPIIVAFYCLIFYSDSKDNTIRRRIYWVMVLMMLLIDNSSWACPEVTLQGRVWGNLVPPGVARLVYDDILMICQNIL